MNDPRTSINERGMNIPRLAGETASAETCNPMHLLLAQDQHNCYRRSCRCMFDSSKSINSKYKPDIVETNPGVHGNAYT